MKTNDYLFVPVSMDLGEEEPFQVVYEIHYCGIKRFYWMIVSDKREWYPTWQAAMHAIKTMHLTRGGVRRVIGKVRLIKGNAYDDQKGGA